MRSNTEQAPPSNWEACADVLPEVVLDDEDCVGSTRYKNIECERELGHVGQHVGRTADHLCGKPGFKWTESHNVVWFRDGPDVRTL